MLTCLAFFDVLSHGFSRKRETALSLYFQGQLPKYALKELVHGLLLAIMQPHSQGLSSYRTLERDAGNKVVSNGG